MCTLPGREIPGRGRWGERNRTFMSKTTGYSRLNSPPVQHPIDYLVVTSLMRDSNPRHSLYKSAALAAGANEASI